MTTAVQEARQRPWWMTLILGIAAFWGVIGGALLVIQAFRVKNA